jgi:hypothetical protein
MLKTCKIATRGTAVGLFFKAIGCQTKTAAWHDALRNRDVRVSPHHFFNVEHTTAENAALFVRTVGIDRIVEQLAQLTKFRMRPEPDPHPVESYILPSDALDVRHTLPVLADKLCSLGHWLGEPLALWVNRPKGTSRAKWQRAAALKFVHALPVPSNVYALRHEPNGPPLTSGEVTSIRRITDDALPKGTRDPLVLARVVEDAMLRLVGRTCMFTLHALSDTEWAVRIGSHGYSENVFRMRAPPDDRIFVGLDPSDVTSIRDLFSAGIISRDEVRVELSLLNMGGVVHPRR